jgi:trehalose 6-phosphate phosphatase
VLKPDGQQQIEEFFQAVALAPQALLLLDYDGTLAPFQLDRQRAFPYPGVVPVLQEIASDGHTRIVIISGRDTSEALPLLGIVPAPEVWGLHGLQRRRPNGVIEMLPIDSHSLDALSDADRWLSYQQLRDKAEWKAGSIAMHWRGLSDWEIEDMRGRVLMGWQPIAEHAGLELMEFDGGVEIRVPHKDKGDAVRLLLSETDPHAPAAFLGDDATDERAFRAMNDRGLTVLVRPRWRQTAAQVWLKPPEELLHFLTRWLVASKSVGGETAAAVSG